MDWDDENESTQVYDKQLHDIEANTLLRPAAGAAAPPRVGAAAALLASSGGTAPGVMRPAPSTPFPQPVPASVATAPPVVPSDGSTVLWSRPNVPALAATGNRAGVILGGLALIVVIVLAVFVLFPKKGQVQITVTTPDGAAADKVEIFVDGQKKCDTTPCLVGDLEPGARIIKGIAPGLPKAEMTVIVEGNKEKIVSLELKAGSAPVANGTELKISAADTQKGVKVFVDGEDKGMLPVELKDLPPGPHKLKFDGGDRYEKIEQSVDLGAGQSKDLGAIKLKVLKGQVTIELATEGANVTLVRRAGDKKVEKKLPDLSKPVAVEIDPSENWKIIASKKGYDEFVQELNFDDGQADKKINVELLEAGKPAKVARVSAAEGPAPGPVSSPRSAAAPVSGQSPATSNVYDSSEAKETSTPATASGMATLNINSIPVSKAVLDGKPLGSTPKVGVSVSPGSHTVTFIHPDMGKASVTVQVKAGETKAATHKFK
jgi:serine/threonine-protein kinase